MPLTVLLCVFALALTGQALLTLRMNLHHWNDPSRRGSASNPMRFRRPARRFTLLVPARHEQAVIAETVRRMRAASYPQHLVEIVVVCHEDDRETIDAVRADVPRLLGVRVKTFSGDVVNKPHALNVGLSVATGDVVGVFDAEDDVHPDLLNVVNTLMLDEGVRVVQGGVQLTNTGDRWFSLHNCLEYFFWFKSRLQFQAEVGAIPLGGNTVFFDRELLLGAGGWDEQCLTEDADIGMRLSATGERIRVVHGTEWVTKEEAPHTVGGLVKQRTRWHQGFIQVLGKGDWRRLPDWRQRLLAFLTLSSPLFEGAMVLLLPVFVAVSISDRVPTVVAMIATIPLYVLLLQIGASTVAAVLLSREFGLRIGAASILRVPFTYLPYQLLLGAAAVRAIVRHVGRKVNWEKTAHLGAHRTPLPVPVLAPALQDAA